MIQTPAERYTRARSNIHDLLLSRTQRPGEEWMTLSEIVAGTGHLTNTVTAALADLGSAGLVNRHPAHEGTFRARGTLATPGPTLKEAMSETHAIHADTQPQAPCKRRHQDPADAAQRRAEYLRKEALAFAIQHAEGETPDGIVAAAAKFEKYLSGQQSILPVTFDEAAFLRQAVEDAVATVSLIDSPDTLGSLRSALPIADNIVRAAKRAERNA